MVDSQGVLAWNPLRAGLASAGNRALHGLRLVRVQLESRSAGDTFDLVDTWNVNHALSSQTDTRIATFSGLGASLNPPTWAVTVRREVN